MNTVRGALKDLNKEELEESISSGGWIINEEDNILDLFINEKKLNEEISTKE